MKMSFTDMNKWFVPAIKKVAMSVFKQLMPFQLYIAEVDSVSTDYADVTLVSDSTSLSNIVNKTGETLTSGDRVWVCAMNRNLGNAFIWVRLENDIA